MHGRHPFKSFTDRRQPSSYPYTAQSPCLQTLLAASRREFDERPRVSRGSIIPHTELRVFPNAARTASLRMQRIAGISEGGRASRHQCVRCDPGKAHGRWGRSRKGSCMWPRPVLLRCSSPVAEERSIVSGIRDEIRREIMKSDKILSRRNFVASTSMVGAGAILMAFPGSGRGAESQPQTPQSRASPDLSNAGRGNAGPA